MAVSYAVAEHTILFFIMYLPTRAASAAACALLFSYTASAQKVVGLEGRGWTVTNPAQNVSVPGKLPSQAHLDLYAANVIGDPYYNINDFNLRWVAWSNWTYTSDPIAGLSSDASTWLLFNGLDTFTSISFCGKHVASTDNQFRQYWFDISDLMKGCSPASRVLAINFGSAPTIANEIAAQPGAETWPYGVQIKFEFQNRYYIRKEQSDFGIALKPMENSLIPADYAGRLGLGPVIRTSRTLAVSENGCKHQRL